MICHGLETRYPLLSCIYQIFYFSCVQFKEICKPVCMSTWVQVTIGLYMQNINHDKVTKKKLLLFINRKQQINMFCKKHWEKCLGSMLQDCCIVMHKARTMNVTFFNCSNNQRSKVILPQSFVSIVSYRALKSCVFSNLTTKFAWNILGARVFKVLRNLV